MAKISLQGIAHSYINNPTSAEEFALQSMDQEWQDGGAYALLGPSGCGKTTLLNIISGLLQPTRGRVLFDDIDVTQNSPEQRNIAQVFQFPVVYDSMTVAENLAFPLRNRNLAAAEIKQRLEQTLAMLGLQAMANRKARSLNAADKQKISLGRGLVRTDVNAILFDEPLTVINPQLKWELRTELKNIHQRFGHSMVYVTHDQTEALTFADQVIVMHEGTVVQVGTPQQLFEKPEHTFVGKFIGSPGMNILPCHIEADRVIVAGQSVALTDLARPHLESAGTGNLELGIRPEFVTLNDDQGIPARILAVEDLGKHKVVRLSLGGIAVNAIVSHGTTIPEQPKLRFDSSKINIYQDSILTGQGMV